jgi:hypothetical protein
MKETVISNVRDLTKTIPLLLCDLAMADFQFSFQSK